MIFICIKGRFLEKMILICKIFLANVGFEKSPFETGDFSHKKIRTHKSSNFLYYKAAFAFSTKDVNAFGSATAISLSIFLLISILAFLRPFINFE